MNIYGREQKIYNVERTLCERWLLHLYTFATGVQLACFIFGIIRTANAASEILDNSFFITSPLQIKPLTLKDSCSLLVEYHPETIFSSVKYLVSTDNVGYFISRNATNIRLLFTCAALNIVVCAINRMWVWMEMHEMRYHFVVIRHDVLIVWELFLTIIGIVMLEPVARERDILSTYFLKCAKTRRYALGRVTNYMELHVSFYLALSVFTLNALAAVVIRTRKNPGDGMMETPTLPPHLPPQLPSTYAPGETHPRRQLHNPPLHGVRNEGGNEGLQPSNGMALDTTAAPMGPAGPVENIEHRCSDQGFGPSVSQPMTPITLGPRLGHLHRRDDGAMSVMDSSCRSGGVGAQLSLPPAAEAPLARFQVPPPSPSLSGKQKVT
ncbi:hypothetical protein TraAM80_02700 [Trypanosoma rangeli]|uniref:Uncharacterized protein n=1 Tax=Trypanosoma rangeli TaxID=5698 RepID=A0A3R7L6A1_TRYRA|nr:uncharacterized protein TraAM80_02700 [Trypanosoma rangeli]RNF08475.1 hypothetical protein TraAM80_02700 [Trypanosoma rangeli]|eukprot:RNF08475.1 hypothetical protein TraAM80_02700 [Trypanosoma rangeli]